MSLVSNIPPELKLFLSLEERLPRAARERTLVWLERLWFLLFIVALFTNEWRGAALATKVVGLILLVLAIWLIIYASVLFSRSVASRLIIGRYKGEKASLATLAVLNFDPNNVLAGWFHSAIGETVQMRLGLSSAELEKIVTEKLVINQEVTSLPDLAQLIFQQSAGYREAAERAGLNLATVMGASAWVETINTEFYLEQAWWRWENLARVSGLAKDWHYGETHNLLKYGYEVIAPLDSGSASPFLPDVLSLESVLNRSREANAILIGEADQMYSVIENLAGRIRAGVTWPALESKKIIWLETGKILAVTEGGESLSVILLKLIQEAGLAGNVIIVFDDLPQLVAGCGRRGDSFASLLDSYLASSAVTVIGLADPAAYRAVLEPDAVLLNRFETVRIQKLGQTVVLKSLSEAVLNWEERSGLFFTFEAVQSIADSAAAYFGGEGNLAEAGDLLEELVPWLVKNNLSLVTKENVLTFVKEKVRMPVGPITAAERDQFLNLEETLRARVVGQREAIEAVAKALRRARAGTRNANKPIGNFLFLGPTGVGKTETAKALSAALFGREDALLRLDMSEYASDGSLERLIGSFETGEAGTLSALVRDNPYGVLLLDEFEKTHPKVQNLFLQIFDEGFFSDMRGRRVSLRSLAIIATSNAGAELIWDLVGKGESLVGKDKELIDELIHQGLFKPELLNRFDATVIFSPLGPEELKQIAKLMLNKLVSRLQDKGVRLELNPALIEAVAKVGYNRQFGARSMQRLIQEAVEQPIADGLIAGRIKSGQIINFVPARFQDAGPLGLEISIA